MIYLNERDCSHGQLKRSCDICEYEKEIAELKDIIKITEQHSNEYLAHCERLREKAEKFSKFACDDGECDCHNCILRDVINENPAQSLAEIQAQAIEDMMSEISQCDDSTGYVYYTKIPIIAYANRIREQTNGQ